MKEIAQIRKLSLGIFIIPLFAINLCLFISQNPEFLENTFFSVDQIGRSGFSIPYLDGSLSISRASRTFPQYLIFKPAMFLTAFLLFMKRFFCFSFSTLCFANDSKCLVSRIVYYTLNDSPHPQRSVSLGFLNTNSEENLSVL